LSSGGGHETVRDITGDPEYAICRDMKRILINSGRNGADVGTHSEENGQDGLLNIDFPRSSRFKSELRHYENKKGLTGNS